MSLSIFTRPWLAVIVTGFLVAACQPGGPKPPAVDPGFRQYISGFTSGVISSGAAIRIQLAAGYRGAGSDTLETNGDLFSFSPGIKGSMVWTDDRTLEFRPEKDLPRGKVINGKFHLSRLMDVPGKFATFPFQVEVMKQYLRVLTDGLTTADPEGKSYNFRARLTTADTEDPALVEKTVKIFLDGSEVPVVWEHQDDRLNHFFSIDSIARHNAERTLRVEWDGDAIGSDQEGEEKVTIPASGDFRVMGVKVIQEPEQSVTLTFSDPLEEGQQFAGLITVDQRTDLKFSLLNNHLEVYLPVELQRKKILFADAAIRNVAGKRLGKPFSAPIIFEDVKPGVRLTGKGVILPSSAGLILPFEAVNLSKVDVRIIRIYSDNIRQFLQVNRLDENYELQRVGTIVHRETLDLLKQRITDPGKWNTWFCDLTKIIRQEPGAIYHVILSFRKEYSLYQCTTVPADDEEGQTSWNAGEQEVAEDEYSDYYGFWPQGYRWDQHENPCHISYYTPDRMVRRNILASDLGIIVKAGEEHDYRFFVTDLSSTNPVSSVNLDIYDYQNQLLTTLTTDQKGMAGAAIDGKPWLVIARQGDQRGYIRIDDGSALSLSKFDVTGTGVRDGLKGFVYGERGVWRPGDTLFLTLILQNRLQQLPAGYPVTLELINPRGQLYHRSTRTDALNGFYRFVVVTDESVPTGNWTANFRAGGSVFSRNLKIESVKPNRLKMNLDFGTSRISSGSPLHGKFTSSWLTGAPAPELKLVITATLSKGSTTFRGYNGFIFEDPSRHLEAEEQVLFEGRTDASGNATVTGRITPGSNAPGMLTAGFLTRLFEQGGDFSRDFFTIPLSPYPVYVGIRPPDRGKGPLILENDRNHSFEVVTVDESGKPVSRQGLVAEIVKLQWRWWWSGSDEAYATYEGAEEQGRKQTINLATVEGKGNLVFKIDDDWGRYMVRILDREGHASAVVFYVDYPYGSPGREENKEAATMLTFSTDKEEYQPGETASIIIPSGGVGRALISVESGSRVIDAFWTSLREKETRVPLKITPEMAPNIYLHVTLIQPHAQTVNDLPVRLYGVIPVKVTDPASLLHPVAVVPDEVRPEKPFTIRVSEKDGRAMTYTLSIVDEGLLDLTRFTTPDPWQSFNAREALGVRTWDLYDYVLGAYGGRMEQLFAIGGDRDLLVANPKKVNRFRPVVASLGPFELKRGATAIHQVKLPPYVGSVRVMLVAGQNGAFGSSDKTVKVKNPLMVLATLPRVLGPGEHVKLPVTVFAMDPSIREVNIRVMPDNGFVSDAMEQKVTFTSVGDRTVSFDLGVAKAIGAGKVKVLCTAGQERAETTVDILIRSANSISRTYSDAVVEPGKELVMTYACPGMEGTNKAFLEAGGIFPADFNGRLNYLITYPYGCLEQNTSAAFPQLFLGDIQQLSTREQAKTQANVQAALNRMKGFQQPGGDFSYWPGSGSGSGGWSSVYAAHFMIEAGMKGYVIPADMKEAWIKQAAGTARSFGPDKRQNMNYYSGEEYTQAYRLYVLALAGSPQMAAMNRLRESGTLNAETRQRLAAAYILAGQKETGRALMQQISIPERESPGVMETFGSRLRDQAMLLESWCLLGDLQRSYTLAREVASQLSSDEWMSTQTTAYSLVAISKFLIRTGDNRKGISFSYREGSGEEITIGSDRPFYRVALPAMTKGGKVTIKNRGAGPLYLRLLTSGIPAEGEEKPAENNLRLKVTYKDLQGKTLDVAKIPQTTTFCAEVSVTNPGSIGSYRNLALSQIFPSGWEIINRRLDDLPEILKSDPVDYTDIRDDRVNTFFDLDAGATKRIIVQLNAAYQGRFYLPGPVCEAMYYNWIGARTGGKWVEVTANDQ